MYVAIWRYRIEEANRAPFEQAYGPGGDWAHLFGRQSGYLGTELLREEPEAERAAATYVTIDRWESESDWLGFIGRHEGDYRALDARFEALTEAEERIGTFAAAG